MCVGGRVGGGGGVGIWVFELSPRTGNSTLAASARQPTEESLARVAVSPTDTD